MWTVKARWRTYSLWFLCLFVCGKSHIFRYIKWTFKKGTKKERPQSVTGTYWPWLLRVACGCSSEQIPSSNTQKIRSGDSPHPRHEDWADKGNAVSYVTSSQPLSLPPTESPPNILIIIYSSNHDRNYFITSRTFPHRTGVSNSSVMTAEVHRDIVGPCSILWGFVVRAIAVQTLQNKKK